jgi:hypothetical protein
MKFSELTVGAIFGTGSRDMYFTKMTDSTATMTVPGLGFSQSGVEFGYEQECVPVTLVVKYPSKVRTAKKTAPKK